jgi:hypothetical protein
MRTTSESFDSGPWRVVGFYDRRLTVEKMSQNKWFRQAAVVAVACAMVASVVASASSTGAVVSAAGPVDAGGEFHPLTPTRILDTRPEEGKYDVAPLGPKPSGVGNATTAEFKFDPLGRGGLPTDPADVLAVVMTVTVTQPTQSGYLSAYPTGFDFGGDDISALLTFEAGADVPNLAILGVGPDGTITFNANTEKAGSYHLVVDVFGWISTSAHDSGGGRLELVNPGRIMDTRAVGNGVESGCNPNPRAPGRSLAAADSVALQIRGAAAVCPAQPNIVPNDSRVTAVLVNLALVNNNPTSQPTYVTATPTSVQTNPDKTANSLAVAGGIHANMAVVPVGNDGKIHLFNNAGELDLVVDVLGYFIEDVDAEWAATNRGRVVPLEAPFRAFDTRETAFGDAPLPHGTKESWSFKQFAESVTLNPDAVQPEVAPEQLGLIGGLFAVDLKKTYPSDSDSVSSYLQMYPGGLKERPLSANVNFFPGEIVPNTSLIKYGTVGADAYVVDVYNAYGSIDYVLDVYAIVLA